MTLFGDPIWAELLSLANITFGFIIFGINILRIKRKCEKGFICTFTLIQALLGLYWGLLYVFVFTTPAGPYDAVLFGRVFVRPMFTFTLALMASVAIYRYRKTQ